jgi:hypothetical protein
MLIVDLPFFGRYDLDSLFNKAYGNLTINVQGLARVGASPHFISLSFCAVFDSLFLSCNSKIYLFYFILSLFTFHSAPLF